ncbi:MAG: hypothetical protein AAFO91_01570 [Bacteroidota bacterium]
MGGTSRAEFKVRQNKKKQFVQTISYMGEYGEVPLPLLRLQDYLVFNRSRQSLNPRVASKLGRYMANAVQESPGNNNNLNNQSNLNNQNNNNNFSGMNQQKSLFNSQTQQQGMTNNFNNFNKPGGMFSQTNKPTGMGANFNMAGSRNIALPGTQTGGTGLFNSANTMQRPGGMLGQTGMQGQQKSSMFPSMGNNMNTMNNMNNTTNTNTGLFNKTGMGGNTMGQSTLFTKNNQGASSMFQSNPMSRNNNMGTTGGLFNTNNSQVKPMTGTTGLFNTNNASQQKPTSLFNTGNQMKPSQTTSTLFNTGNTATGASGLFQSKPTASSGLFNSGLNSQQNKPGAMTGTGLFNKPATGLFNKPANAFANNNNSNTLFNKPQMLNQQGFNQANTNNTQMMMPMMNPAMQGGYAMVCVPLNNNNTQNTLNAQGQANGSTQPLKNSGINNINQQSTQISAALQKLFKSSGYNMGTNTQATSQESVNSVLEQFKKFDTNHYSQRTPDAERESFYDSMLSTASRDGPIVQRSNEATYLKAKANAQKVLRGMRRRRRATPGSKSLKSSSAHRHSESLPGKLTDRTRKISKHIPEDQPGKVLSHSIRQSNMNAVSGGPSYAPQNAGEAGLVRPNPELEQRLEDISEIKGVFKKKPEPDTSSDSVEVQVVLEKFGKDSKFKFKLNCNDLVSSILTTAQARKLLTPEELSTTMVIFNNKTLDLTASLSSQGVKQSVSDPQVLYLYPKGTMDRYFADTRVIPVLERADYQCKPSIVQLSRMTETELEAVEKFEISNQHGKIVFESPVDLRSANLDQIVKIEHKFVEVYGKDSGPKPPVGSGLNVSAMVTYYGYRRKEHVPIEKFIKTLKRQAKKIRAEFIDYNEKKEHLTITVKHF